MPTGIVITSRGKSLNIDELIQQSQRPIGMKDAASTKEKGNYKPRPNAPRKIRGFIPSGGESINEINENNDETKVEKEIKEDTGPKKSLSEHTKITVKKTSTSKKAPTKKIETQITEDDEILGSILNNSEIPE